MRGKVAREIRKAIRYDSKALRNPDGVDIIGTNAYCVDQREGLQYVIDPDGEHQVGDLKFSIKKATKDIYQLKADPIRAVYQMCKKEWYSFSRQYKNMKFRELKQEEGINSSSNDAGNNNPDKENA